MARKVFFSFHYERDVWRAFIVRNSDITRESVEEAGFIDAAEFEELERHGSNAVKRWINSQLEGTSVTAVLIGSKTYSRRWVRYEIIKSFDRGNGLLGIYIHNIKDQNGNTDLKGPNPFKYVGVHIDRNGKAKYRELESDKWVIFDDYPNCSLNFPKEYWTGEIYTFRHKLYDWIYGDGYKNFGDWVEEAAKQEGR